MVREITTERKLIIMANMPRLYQVSRAIRRFPENHDQGSWHDSHSDETGESEYTVVHADDGQHPACGTTMCFAGWTAFLFAPEGSKLSSDDIILADGGRVDIEEFAVEALDLTSSQSMALFYTAQDIDDIDAAIDTLEANPEIEGFDLRETVRDYHFAQVNKQSAGMLS